ncbi:MAG: helix-turn-helix domain-containing protein [Patescibacteria group bacterium]|nr:helix-turn-helix domain-containing protein [Patescibacteria group bacterium]
MIQKQILVPRRVRRPPKEGWSWIDRRFVREHAPRLSQEAILLYFFLAAVSDKDGLSFYREGTIAVRLRMTEAAVVRARDELIAADLLAHRAPLAQVLSLSDATVQRRDGGLMQFGELLRSLAGSPEMETTSTRRLP